MPQARPFVRNCARSLWRLHSHCSETIGARLYIPRPSPQGSASRSGATAHVVSSQRIRHAQKQPVAGSKLEALRAPPLWFYPVSYTHLRAHETRHDLVCRLLLEKKKKIKK